MELWVHFPSISTYLLTALLSVCLLALRIRRRPRYPPGPSGLPVVGNLFDVPTHNAWIKYKQLGEKHGSDMLHFEVFESQIVVLNSTTAARDILERRSQITSDRAHSVMINELSGWDEERNFGFMRYGDHWRRQRRLFQQYFRQKAVTHYHPIQSESVHTLLKALLDRPEQFIANLRFMAGSMILKIVYGTDIQPGDSRLTIVEKAIETLMELMNAGVFLVDVFPILKYLPSWIPGAGFKKKAAEWRALVDGMYEVPYNDFKASMAEGTASPCLLASIQERKAGSEDSQSIDADSTGLAGTAFGGGSDTTVGTLSIFLLAMTKFPLAQVAAQEELDRVLEKKRLPTIEDRDALPRTTAIMYEVLRWYSPFPLGVPHRTIGDQEYNGYFIPAGTTIIANAWAMLHDEEKYPNPNTFIPERFLNEDGSLRSDACLPTEPFGFGRRICPGRYFAHDIVWLAIANILSVFRVEPPVDGRGEPVKPTATFGTRFLSTPTPFECRFTPRYPEAEGIIRASATNVA